jgi:hypothetical protein
MRISNQCQEKSSGKNQWIEKTIHNTKGNFDQFDT